MRRNASVLLEEATSMADKGFRITYATMSADNEQLHADYEKGVEVSRGWLGQQHQFYVNGEARTGSGYREERSPIDQDVLIGEFAQATREDVRVAGDELVHHPDVDGITFTGSYEVGMGIYKSFATDFPKPVICEMGGKNPTIVTGNADLDKATDGVMRSAFGFGGQKCSANSRVYVHRSVYDEFVRKLREKTEAIKVGDPLQKENWLGPIIDEKAMETFEEAAAEAKKNGNVITGGGRPPPGA